MAKPREREKVIIMREIHERPVCHRAEDLVSFLYGELSQTETLDYGNHLQHCDACRGEFAVFNNLHDSMQLWRKEALGVSFNPAQIAAEPVISSTQFVRHGRKLSAISALREFFSVSPLWLRGATAFAGLLLCALGVMMIAQVSRRPAVSTEIVSVPKERTYTQQEVDAEVAKAVDRTTREQQAINQNQTAQNAGLKDQSHPAGKRPQVAVNQIKNTRPRRLNRQEREQLAADLRLTSPADEEELLSLPDQDKPNQ